MPVPHRHRRRLIRQRPRRDDDGPYKAECVYGPDSHGWDDVADLELVTLSWVHWFNEQRLHSHCGDVPPAEFETAFYAALQADPAGVGNR